MRIRDWSSDVCSSDLPDRLDDAALAEAVTAMAERVGKETFLRQQQAIMGRPDSRPGLPAIRVPTLVLCGRQDASTPLELSEEIAAGIAGSRLCIIEDRSEEHTSELQSLMRISYAVFCLKKKTNQSNRTPHTTTQKYT